MNEVKVILKPDREKPVLARHPWIFSGAIDLIDDDFQPGDLVRIHSSHGHFLAKGFLDPRSDIAIRILTFQDRKIDREFFERRMREALRLREALPPPDTDALRLINSEGDYLPGLIADRYGPYLVVEILTPGMESLKDVWAEPLRDLTGASAIYSKAGPARELPDESGEKFRALVGPEPPDFVEIRERGVKFWVDIVHGQKTGFFIDQRENRHRVRGLANGRRVLNAFSYTGGFSVNAALGGASSVISVDSSESAMNTCRHNFELNGIDPSAHEFVREDVFDYLRRAGGHFDLIVLDPPAFAKSKAQIMQASRGYKDINLWALKNTAPGGFLFTFSCSSYIDSGLFQKIIFAAAKDAKRKVQILERTSHAFDHPVSVYHPEGEYLKGLLCRVL